MGKQRIHTSLGPRRIEDELCLSILLRDGVVVIDCDCPISIPVLRYPHPEDSIVDREGKQASPDDGQDRPKDQPAHSNSETRRKTVVHEPQIIASASPLRSLTSSPFALGLLASYR